jgi:hypothetical protein
MTPAEPPADPRLPERAYVEFMRGDPRSGRPLVIVIDSKSEAEAGITAEAEPEAGL